MNLFVLAKYILRWMLYLTLGSLYFNMIQKYKMQILGVQNYYKLNISSYCSKVSNYLIFSLLLEKQSFDYILFLYRLICFSSTSLISWIHFSFCYHNLHFNMLTKGIKMWLKTLKIHFSFCYHNLPSNMLTKGAFVV